MKFIKSSRNVYIKNDDDTPFRIQIPKMKGFINEYGKLELEVNQLFNNLWTPIEDECREHGDFPWNENPRDGKFRVRVDENTHVFDSHSELLNDFQVDNRFVTCIIEIQSIYNFKQQSGLTCKVHQMKIHDPEFMFIPSD